MADIISGGVSTLPGASHHLPEGTTCDQHVDRPAVARVQGETDSMGCELNDMCQECLDAYRAYVCSPAARTGKCDWCHQHATDLRPRRDYEEGLHGRTYDVCGACVRRKNERLKAELAADDWDDAGQYDDLDDGEDE